MNRILESNNSCAVTWARSALFLLFIVFETLKTLVAASIVTAGCAVLHATSAAFLRVKVELRSTSVTGVEVIALDAASRAVNALIVGEIESIRAGQAGFLSFVAGCAGRVNGSA